MLSSVGLRLHEEMKLDMQRIWKRNLGRDDRCIADSGKEVLLTSWTKIIPYVIDWSHVAIILLFPFFFFFGKG
jgi:hypothetical protein